jgi:hypothetical protein
MIRLSTLFWLIVVSTAGFAMFAVKYEVQALADQLARTVKQTDDAERDLRVLDAEWAYLNRPDALAQMNQRFLALLPVATRQLRNGVADIPMRPAPPPPPPPPPPVETVAAPGAAVAALSVAEAQNQPAQAAAAAISAEPAAPPAEAPPHIVTVALDTPVTVAEPARPAPAKPAPRPLRASPPRRARSLNELIAQITESR